MQRIKISRIGSVIIILFAAFGTIVLSFILQPNSIREVYEAVNEKPIILLYNLLPVILLMFVFYFAFSNVWVGTLAGSTIIGLLSVMNRYKIIFREDPLVPMDVFLGMEAVSFATKSKLGMETKYLFLLIFMIAIQVIAIIYTKSNKLHGSVRIIGITMCLMLSVFLYHKIYNSKEVYENLPVKGHPYLVSNHFNTKGFVYCFLYNINAYTIDKPENYDQEEIEEILQSYKQPIVKKKSMPHVIMIMGEAFSDISLNKNLRFREEDDPLQWYKQLKKENVINGSVIVPNFGGGTANTEFDVLTGCVTLNISESSTSSFRLVRRSFDALPREFKKINYTTLAIHPGYDWFYNRKNVYRYFGFDRSIFKDAFHQEDVKGNYISEKATIDKVIEEFKKHIRMGDGNPLFLFCVTIQNHNPYLNSKYDGKAEQTFLTDLDLSGSAKEQLINYFEGIKDADQGIKTLVKYFDSIDEPVVLVYFGDHLPYLGPDYLAYREIGYDIEGSDEESLNSFRTPFFIWQNEEAKGLIKTDQLELPENKTISSNYLGALVLEMLGHQEISPFIHFVNEMRRDVPVITRHVFMVDNQYIQVLPAEIMKKVNLYKRWQYYQMK